MTGEVAGAAGAWAVVAGEGVGAAVGIAEATEVGVGEGAVATGAGVDCIGVAVACIGVGAVCSGALNGAAGIVGMGSPPISDCRPASDCSATRRNCRWASAVCRCRS